MKVIGIIKRKLLLYKLRKIKTVEKFKEHVQKVNYRYFLIYISGSKYKRMFFQSIVDYLELDLEDIRILDIGTGYGDPLDIAKEKGKADCAFVDIDPYFVAFNRLKGYRGYDINYLSKEGFSKMRRKCERFDLIYSRGSMNDHHFTEVEKGNKKGIKLDDWLNQLDKLLAVNGSIIISPTFKKTDMMLDDEPFVTMYYCEDIEEYKKSWFVKTMLNHGYTMLPHIEGHNHPKAFPITFYKHMEVV